MIYGNINSKHFEQELAILPRPLQNAIRFLKDNDLANHEPGRFDLDFRRCPCYFTGSGSDYRSKRNTSSGNSPQKYRRTVPCLRRTGKKPDFTGITVQAR